MSTRDAAPILRKVASLRALCHRLPHKPTELELWRLRRFDALVNAPGMTTLEDVGAVTAGWRCWWRAGNREAIRVMASGLPTAVLDADRWLQTFVVGAQAQGDR